MTTNQNTGDFPLTSAGDKHPHKGDITGPSPLGEGRVDAESSDREDNAPWSSIPHRHGSVYRRMLPNHSQGPWKKISIILVLALVLYSLVGFLLAPYLLTTTLPKVLAQKLNRPVTIGSAHVNPYTLKITLKNGIIGPDLSVADDKVDPVLSFGRLEGRINPFFFLKNNQLIKSVRCNSAFVHLIRQKDGRFNITTIFSKLAASETSLNLARLAPVIQAGDINLTNSRLIFTDQTSDSQHTLEEISFLLPKSDNTSTAISPHFSAIVNGSPVSVGGRSESSADGQNTRLTFTLEKINLADYLTYLPPPLPGLITKGEADMELLVDYRISPDKSYHFEISGSGVGHDIWLHSPEKVENKIAYANFSIRFAPLLSQLTITKLILDQPEIQLQRQKDGTYIFPGADQEQAASAEASIKLETLVVKNGRLSYIDQKVQGGFGTIFNEINLSMDRTIKEDDIHTYALNCVTSRLTRIASQGKLSLNKGSVDGLLILHNLPVAALNSYLPTDFGVTLSSGIIDKAETTLQLRVADTQNTIFSLSKLKGSATNLDILYQGKKWLHIDQGFFTDATLSSGPLPSSLGKMSLSGLLGYFSPADTGFLTQILSRDNNAEAEPFTELEIKNGTLLLHDFSFQEMAELPVKLIEFNASGFGTKAHKMGKIDATLGLPKNGQCQLQGDLSLTPLTGNLQLTMSHVPLDILSAKKIEWFAAKSHNGLLDGLGTFSLADYSFTGHASLANFQVHKKSTTEMLISLKKASAPKIHLGLKPFSLQIDTLDLDTLSVVTTLSKDVDSLSVLFFHPSKPDEMPQGNLTVNKITLKNSFLHFSDTTLNPPFTKSLSGIHGTLTHLTNTTDNSLGLDISATNDDQASLFAKGSINLFSESFGAAFSVSLVGQTLDPFIPYLEPMVGHELSGGIFDFAVSYKESAGKVNADTLLTLRHLTLGAKDLGNKQFPTSIALVTDNNLSIKLDLPVIGDMTDPSYTFYRAYGKKIRNLISKASVSPFSLLTGFYDSTKPAPDHVLFEAGATEPTSQGLPTLLAIKDILTARPLLSVTVKGYSSGTEDRDALLKIKRDEEEKKRLALQHSLSTEIIGSYVKEEIETPPVLPIPGDASALLTVSKEELLTLAKQRCRRLKEILIAEYGIPENRILISPDTSVVPTTGAGLAGNRADFILGRVDLIR